MNELYTFSKNRKSTTSNAVVSGVPNTGAQPGIRKNIKFEQTSADEVDNLIWELTNQSDCDLQMFAAKSLGEAKDPRAVEPLILLFKKGPCDNAATSVAEALGKLNDSRAVEPLIYMGMVYQQNGDYDEPHADINSIWALGNIKDSRAVEPLVELLIQYNKYLSENLGERNKVEAAIWALGEIGDTRAIDSLIPLRNNVNLHQKYPDITATVQWALDKINGSGDVEPLIQCLDDKSDDPRIRTNDSNRRRQCC
jgi:HEAT repeat protein